MIRAGLWGLIDDLYMIIFLSIWLGLRLSNYFAKQYSRWPSEGVPR